MPSPDFSNYIDFTIYDIDPTSIYDEAIAYARTAVPEFSPRTGTLEDAIMQAVAYNTSLIYSQINRLPNGLMEGLARLSGLERLEATFATGTALIEVFDNNGVTVSAGTVVQYEVINDDIVTSYPFETTVDLIIPEGETSGSVAIQAIYAGQYPALLTSQELTLVSPAPSVIAITLDSTLLVGTDTETDTEFFNRATQHFASLSSVLTTKTQLANYIKANYPNIPYFGVFDLTTMSDLAWDAEDIAGAVTLVVGNTVGGNLDNDSIDSLLTDIQSKCVAGLAIELVNYDKVNIIVSCEIALSNGYTSLEVRNAVDSYLTSVLSYSGYNFSGTIIKNELISGIATIPGVKYVSDITITSIDGDFSYNSGTGIVQFANKNNVPNADVTVTVI
jgi:hypothetical protein